MAVDMFIVVVQPVKVYSYYVTVRGLPSPTSQSAFCQPMLFCIFFYSLLDAF